MEIWCLFNIYNEYNQPENNLVAWWENKPNIYQLANIIGIQFDVKKGNKELGRILNGKRVEILDNQFRLQKVTDNTKIKNWDY